MNSKGVSSILIVGLILALAVGLFGLWYLNSQQVKLNEMTNQLKNASNGNSLTNTVDDGLQEESADVPDNVEVKELNPEGDSFDDDLNTLEVQMSEFEAGMDVEDLDSIGSY